ncbi:MAG: HWE histidine kinase domain-containing protein [Pseudomonadota bacterium]
MTSSLSESEVERALETCAEEPVHIPGIVQPFGCLIAARIDGGTIGYASENCGPLIGIPAKDLLGESLRDMLGGEIHHGIRNAVSRATIAEASIGVGVYDLMGKPVYIRVFESQGHHVVEIEPDSDTSFDSSGALKTLSYLMSQLQSCEDEQSLFDLTAELMRHLSGYDRTLIYRFDSEKNGEVLAEARRSSLESLLGLRFPSWDIPAQARAIMAKIPLRFIQDVDQVPAPLFAASPDAPPLDISLAASRGVSPVHVQYLRNMGVRGTMTLSVIVEDQLWGIISFHNLHPRVPPPALREILINFGSIFSGKLLALRQKSTLDKISALDRALLKKTDGETRFDRVLPVIAPTILDAIEANGIAAFTGGEASKFGETPDDGVLFELSGLAATSDGVVAIESLAEKLPDKADQLGAAAGALLVGVPPDRAVCVFRNDLTREVAWAGDPRKTVETVSGDLRLSPRASFSAFLEKVEGRCQAWSDEDIFLIGHIRTLLHSAERQAMMDTLNRQQALMIGELNHRVRNILALVRSVSRQARRRYGSLNSYANAIEQRIRALAASHDLSVGSATAPVSLVDLVKLELEPFGSVAEQRVRIEGPELFIRPEVAPILSLVIHELTTNAVKYGALSTPSGELQITVANGPADVTLTWRERGVDSVTKPNDIGFGMAMIQQAAPHELGGLADIEFHPDGVEARFTLAHRHFDAEPSTLRTPTRLVSSAEAERQDTSGLSLQGPALLLEDNFIIAKEMSDQLYDFGVEAVEVFSSAEDALNYLETERPIVAILDVNLGPNRTSEAVAARLQELDIPLLFVTGYGEASMLSCDLGDVPRLTKPVSAGELGDLLRMLIKG